MVDLQPLNRVVRILGASPAVFSINFSRVDPEQGFVAIRPLSLKAREGLLFDPPAESREPRC